MCGYNVTLQEHTAWISNIPLSPKVTDCGMWLFTGTVSRFASVVYYIKYCIETTR